MKVLHIISSVAPEAGGVTQGLVSLQTMLADRVDGHVLSLDAPDAAFLVDFPLPIYALGVDRREDRRNAFARHYGFSPKVIPWLRDHLGDYDAAVVHGLWNYATYAAARVLPKAATPYFVFTHGMMDPWFRRTYPLKHAAKQGFWWFNEGPLLAGARAVLFTAEEERQLARGEFWGHAGYREAVVGFGTNEPPPPMPEQAAAFKHACPQVDGRPYLLFLGRLHPKKGCDLLLKAFVDQAMTAPDLHLVMAGPDQVGWQAELQALTANLGLTERVHFPGALFGDAKWGAMRGAEAFVLPSHQENFGIVVAEAMACATPVLTTDKVNLWREVAACGGGLIEPDTQAGVSRLLSRWAAMSGDDRAAMRRAARAGFEAHFRMEVAADNVFSLFSARVTPNRDAA